MSALLARLSGIERHKLIIASLSVMITTIVIVGFLVESRWGYMKPAPMLIYASSWKDGERTRTDAERQQAEDMQELRRRIAEQKAAEAEAEAEAAAKK
jgi:hypothetical protein